MHPEAPNKCGCGCGCECVACGGYRFVTSLCCEGGGGGQVEGCVLGGELGGMLAKRCGSRQEQVA